MKIQEKMESNSAETTWFKVLVPSTKYQVPPVPGVPPGLSVCLSVCRYIQAGPCHAAHGVVLRYYYLYGTCSHISST